MPLSLIHIYSDEAGTRAALRAMPILKEAGITAKIIRMEPYKDPDEFIKNLGTEAFEERINKARNGFLFSLEILEKEYDMNSPEGKTAFHKEAAKRLTCLLYTSFWRVIFRCFVSRRIKKVRNIGNTIRKSVFLTKLYSMM